jgi:ribosome modulation factor
MSGQVIFFPLACPGEEPCGHSATEHLAFDDGLRAGEAGKEEDECPHYGGDFNLRHAWASGFSVGQMNRGQ